MIGWLVQAFAGVTLMMLFVLALRRPVAYLFGAQWAYALWVLPLLRFVLPPTMLPAPPKGIEIVPHGETFVGTVDAAAFALGWPGLLAALWLGGAALYLSWQQSSYGAFLLHLGPGEGRGDVPDFGGIPVVESDAVDGPMAVGLFRRRIVVPPDFRTRYTPEEQQLALEHELIHHRRFDILWNLVALVILALNWFNPIAHIAFRAFRSDQELACDAVVARRRPEARSDYARALVKSASRSILLTAAPLNHAAFLKRRLKMMHRHGGGWGRSLGGLLAVALAIPGGLAIGAPANAGEERAGRLAQASPPLVLAAAGDVAERCERTNEVRERALQGLPKARREAARTARAADGDSVERPEQAPVRLAAADLDIPVPSARDVQVLNVQTILPDDHRLIEVAERQDAQAARIVLRVQRQVALEAPARAVLVREAVDRARLRVPRAARGRVELAALRSLESALERQVDHLEQAHDHHLEMQTRLSSLGASPRIEALTIEIESANRKLKVLELEIDELERQVEDGGLEELSIR